MKAKAVVVFSGGPDSATALYIALKKGFEVFPITFDYGQLARREIECAREISKMLKLGLILIDLTNFGKIYSGKTSLVDPSKPITSEFSEPIIVPFRNGVMLSIAVAYADSIGAERVFYGAQGSDAKHYPDCRENFVEAYESAARLGTNSKISIEAPLITLKKGEVFKLGKELGVPFEMTWSCYSQNMKHCGKCESCNNRKRAFADADIKDPTEYETV
jgi:7-cyano-7-deazaguanine synthase